MEAFLLCGIFRRLKMINYSLALLIDAVLLTPDVNFLESLVYSKTNVNNWTWSTFNHLSIQENLPGVLDVDITEHNDHSLFEKLHLQHEFLDLVNVNDFYSNSLHLQNSLEEIEFQMHELDVDDRLILFLDSIQDFSYELIDLLSSELHKLDES